MNSAAAGKRSLIAGVNAWFRAAETARPARAARILEDRWARSLMDRDPRIAVIRGLSAIMPPLARVVQELQVAHCVRHRSIDELLLVAVRRDGFRQVVVVGAGYDMRPSRFASALSGIRWLELDAEKTQLRKWKRLAGDATVRPVARGAVDLEVDRLAASLARADFDVNQPTCFVIEGLVHYLTPAAHGALMDDIASIPSPTRVLFSFIDPQMRRSATPLLMGLFGAMREIPRSFQTAQVAQAELSRRGFRDLQTWSFAEQVGDFVPAATRSARRLETRWWQIVACADRS